MWWLLSAGNCSILTACCTVLLISISWTIFGYQDSVSLLCMKMVYTFDVNKITNAKPYYPPDWFTQWLLKVTLISGNFLRVNVNHVWIIGWKNVKTDNSRCYKVFVPYCSCFIRIREEKYTTGLYTLRFQKSVFLIAEIDRKSFLKHTTVIMLD